MSTGGYRARPGGSMTAEPTQGLAVAGRRPPPGMAWIPGGTFLMGSDHHYPEEAPAHRVTVDGFWMDRYPVMNESFARFVEEAGHRTLAGGPPTPADYPGARADMLYAGSLVFRKPLVRVSLRDASRW